MSNARQRKRRQFSHGENVHKANDHGVLPGSAEETRARILAAYDKVLQRHSTPINLASALPFSKEEIREAIRAELAENPENELRHYLEMAFVHLESFVSRDEYQLVEDFKQLSCAVQSMARSGDPKVLMESWKLVRQASGDKAVRIIESISERMRRRREEARSIGHS